MITDVSLETVNKLKALHLVKLTVSADVIAFTLFSGNVKLPVENNELLYLFI